MGRDVASIKALYSQFNGGILCCSYVEFGSNLASNADPRARTVAALVGKQSKHFERSIGGAAARRYGAWLLAFFGYHLQQHP